MRTTTAMLASLAAAAALAGCSQEDSAEPITTAETATLAATTPESLRNQIYERGISECIDGSLTELAAKYKVKATEEAVVEAVSRSLVKRLDAGPDALVDARAGCKQGFELES